MEEKQILIDNLKINYKIAGRGPAILVLHGWGGSSDSWLIFQKILAKAGYRVIIPDFPGFGKSVTPPKPWGIENYTDFVLKFAQKLGLENSFFMVGHSFGGRISIRFTSQYPEKVKKLVLCDSAGIKPKPGLKTRLIFWMASIGNAIFSPRHLVRLKDTARNLFYIFLRNKDYVKADGTMKETIKKVLEEDLLPELSQIKVKTLIIWGGADRVVPLKYAYIFKEIIKDSQLEIIPRIGHSPHLETPEKLAVKIINFIKEK